MKGYVLRRLAADASTIISLYAGGASFEELSGQYDCSWQTIRRFLIANDIPLRPAPRKLKLDRVEDELLAALADRVPIEGLAKRFSVQPDTVRRFLLAKQNRERM